MDLDCFTDLVCFGSLQNYILNFFDARTCPVNSFLITVAGRHQRLRTEAGQIKYLTRCKHYNDTIWYNLFQWKILCRILQVLKSKYLMVKYFWGFVASKLIDILIMPLDSETFNEICRGCTTPLAAPAGSVLQVLRVCR